MDDLQYFGLFVIRFVNYHNLFSHSESNKLHFYFPHVFCFSIYFTLQKYGKISSYRREGISPIGIIANFSPMSSFIQSLYIHLH